MPRKRDPDRVAAKRNAIAVVAGNLIAERGYENTTVSDIAEAARMSPASVFYYFEDKASVFRAAFERDLQSAASLIDAHKDVVDAVDAVVGIVSALAKSSETTDSSGMLVEILRRAPQDAELRELLRQQATVIKDGLEAHLVRGVSSGSISNQVEPAEAAMWLQAIIDAAHLNHTSRMDLSKLIKRTVESYLRYHEPLEVGHE